MVTDGATEALSPDDEEFGDERLRDLLEATAGGSADAVVRAVVRACARLGRPRRLLRRPHRCSS